jgi:phosphatidate cytidylyltransferase
MTRLDPITIDRLFGWRHAFHHPVTVALLAGVGVVLLAAPLAFVALSRSGVIGDNLRRELWLRYRAWLVLVPVLGVPVLLGAAWTMAAVALLSLFCYREYARATGLFREKFVSLLVVLGILAVTFAVFDNWFLLFEALYPLTTGAITALAVVEDRPAGYIRRVALALFGYTLLGAALGHIGYLANDANYRPVVLLILVAVELNDVFAYASGKTFGRRKLIPNTSPGKTVAGAIGALLLTTPLVAVGFHFIYPGTPLDTPVRLAALGVLVSVLGQLGDLVLSSVKRDLGLKDIGATIPGHGGLLDRFDSLLLVAPAVFHYLNYFVGVGVGQPICIFTGARVAP